MYAGGMLRLTHRLIRLWPDRAQHIVYLYVMMGPLNLYTGFLCRMLGIPVVQELCEWWPCEPSCSGFTRWLHKKPMFKLATGTLVISRAIQARASERAAAVNPFLAIHRLPSIVDTRRFAAASPLVDDKRPGVPNFVYCGTWHHDVYFLVRALARVRRSGYMCKLTIVGNYGPDKDQISKHALENGLSTEDVVFTGCVDERTLEASYKGAVALLMPLWNDDQSATRLPNKMGEYLGSGRPVIGSRIGDLTEFLFDGVNAYLGEPGNEDDFVEGMIAVLRDPERATQIGAAGQAAGWSLPSISTNPTGGCLSAVSAG
jgi:glycosyltransferase involved in cell wall biosynthesis